MGLRDKRRGKKTSSGAKVWNSLPWGHVETSQYVMTNGEGEGDAAFYELEEIDGETFAKSVMNSNISKEENDHENKDLGTTADKKSKVKKRKRSESPDLTRESTDFTGADVATKGSNNEKKKKEKKKKKLSNEKQSTSAIADIPTINFDFSKNKNADWGGIKLHTALVESLHSLQFDSPTRIQALSIPGTLSSGCDIVGSSETGSGKTLAFGLPIIHSLLHEWSTYGHTKCPFALILAPTRELAMQIGSVLTDTCRIFRASDRRIEVVNVIGGMSEHKQKRQLDGTKGDRPVHIMVATPGRLCELMTGGGENMAAFSNLSSIRYLVVDEADRMVEEGHFPELNRIFSCIRDHEKMVERGIDPVEAMKQSQLGIDEETFDDNEANGMNDDPDPYNDGLDLAMLPSEFGGSDNPASSSTRKQKRVIRGSKLSNEKKKRQTLLFSATLLGAIAASNSKVKRTGKSLSHMKPMNSNEVICGKSSASNHLPNFLTQLLDSVALQSTIRIYDSAKEQKTNEKKGVSKAESESAQDEESEAIREINSTSVTESLSFLPKTLQQYEIRAPTEEKDVMAYYFLSVVRYHSFYSDNKFTLSFFLLSESGPSSSLCE